MAIAESESNQKHMTKFIAIILLSALTLTVHGQTDLSSWEGQWRGKLAIYQSSGLMQELPMGLNIIEQGDHWKWQIIYNEGEKQDFRDYSLMPTDSPNQFTLDEHNGIVLRLSLLDNVFHSVFEMNQMILIVSYSLIGDQITFRTQFSPAEDIITSGGQNDATPEVKARKTTTYQIAYLKKS